MSSGLSINLALSFVFVVALAKAPDGFSTPSSPKRLATTVVCETLT